MRSLSRIVQEWRKRLLPPPTGRHAAGAPDPAPHPATSSSPPADVDAHTEPIPDLSLYERRRILPPWAPDAEITPPPAPVVAGDGLDGVRADLAGPIHRILAARPDLGHPAPDTGHVRELAGVR